MKCPQCSAEYLAGHSQCADCHIALVEAEPAVGGERDTWWPFAGVLGLIFVVAKGINLVTGAGLISWYVITPVVVIIGVAMYLLSRSRVQPPS